MIRSEFKVNNFRRAGAVIHRAAGKGVGLAAEHVLQVSRTRNPFEEGTLERSGSASSDGLRGAVTYDTPYAVKQHEDLTLHHKGKGQAKYLESAGTSERRTIAQIIAVEVARVTR